MRNPRIKAMPFGEHPILGTEPAVGDRVGAYRLDAALGHGGMGRVFRAVADDDGHAVAIKVLRQELASAAVYKHRFEHEARAARAVTSRHCVPVIDSGTDAGRQYLVMSYIDGETLAERLEHCPLGLDEMVRIVGQLASGLDAIHRAGIVHRDVKPTNVLIDRGGTALLTDFGLARGEAYTVLTTAGQLAGTVDYLAPELIRGQPASPASDIYALGCVVHECLAGTPPFAGRSVFAVGMAHLNEEPSDPMARRTENAPRLPWAVHQALVKDPEQRPRTATAYAHLIRMAAEMPS